MYPHTFVPSQQQHKLWAHEMDALTQSIDLMVDIAHWTGGGDSPPPRSKEMLLRIALAKLKK